MRYFLVVLFLLTISTELLPQSQRKTAQRKASVEKAPEGVVLSTNRARVKAGYEFVQTSDDQVVARKKKKKNPKPPDTPKDPNIETASFRCSCQSGGGSCKVVTNGQSLFCEKDSCTNCSLVVTKTVTTTGSIGTR